MICNRIEFDRPIWYFLTLYNLRIPWGLGHIYIVNSHCYIYFGIVLGYRRTAGCFPFISSFSLQPHVTRLYPEIWSLLLFVHYHNIIYIVFISWYKLYVFFSSKNYMLWRFLCHLRAGTIS